MKKLFFVPVLVMASLVAHAADKDVEDLLTNMRKAYQSVKSAKFVMDGKLTTPGGNLEVTVAGKFMAPNLLKAEVTVFGQASNVVTDGATIKASAPGMDAQKRKYTTEALNQALPANLEIICFYDWKKQLSTEKGNNMAESKLAIKKAVEWNGRRWLLLQETAPTVGVYVEYYVDQDTWLINRTVVQDLETKKPQGDYRLKSLELGAKVEKKDFKID